MNRRRATVALVFRSKKPSWVCAWQNTGIQTVGFGNMRRAARIGVGEPHAVATAGSQSEAVCGQPVRYVGAASWPPTFGDQCVDCARIVVGLPPLPPAVPEPPTTPRWAAGFAPELPPIEIRGKRIILEPFGSWHAKLLLKAADEYRSSYSYIDVPVTHAEMVEYVERLRAEQVEGKGIAYAIRDLKTARIVGVTRFLSVEWWSDAPEEELRKCPTFVELGGTWLAASAQRTYVNIESKVLMLGYAFENLGVGRVSLHTDERDARARASLLRLGAWFEGVRRGTYIDANAVMQNSAWYSFVAIEWPAVKAVLLQRLGEEAAS